MRSVSYGETSPISGETLNSRRAIRAMRALSIYHDVCHNLETTPFILITSLLADLRHLADELNVDWDSAHYASYHTYDKETPP